MNHAACSFKILALLGALLILVGCSGALPKGGEIEEANIISPYLYTESQAELLKLTGLARNLEVVNFDMPAETISMRLTVYQLDENGEWEAITEGELFPQKSEGAKEKGTIAFVLDEDYTITSCINFQGQVVYQTQAPENPLPCRTFARVFLDEPQKIEMGTEIPVGILIYSEQDMAKVHELNDFFDSKCFQKEGLVRAITLKFTS